MAQRRGLVDTERLAIDIQNVTATGTIQSGPCFVYAVAYCLADSTVSGKFSIGDSSAVGALVNESTRLDVRFGTAAASGNYAPEGYLTFNPPLFMQRNLFYALSTGMQSVSVSLLAAS